MIDKLPCDKCVHEKVCRFQEKMVNVKNSINNILKVNNKPCFIEPTITLNCRFSNHGKEK